MIFCLIVLSSTLCAINFAYGEEELQLIYKSTALPRISKNRPNRISELSILDADDDSLKEIVIVTGSGYIQIYKWQRSNFEKVWQSPQFKYDFPLVGRQAPMVMHEISELLPTYYRNKSDNKLNKSILFFAKTGHKSLDLYEVKWENNQYKLEKKSQAPFGRFRSYGMCSNSSTAVFFGRGDQKGNYTHSAYTWDGSVLNEKWRSATGAGGRLISGQAPKALDVSKDVFFIIDHQSGMLTCDGVKFEMLPIDKTALGKKSLGGGLPIFGATKRNSRGELWFVEYPTSEYSFHTKLYVSQFDGKRFSPFSRVYFKGIDSDMIQYMIIADVDGDGIGEIVGIEEKIRKMLPRKHPGDELGPVLLTSNVFLAKWNGNEYEVKWRKKAIDEKVSNLAVANVTGDGKNKIIITDKQGYLYVFEMPTM